MAKRDVAKLVPCATGTKAGRVLAEKKSLPKGVTITPDEVLTMKFLCISCLLPLVFAPACLGQGKVEGYVEVDGKPFKNATVIVHALTTHMESGDWWVPIITPKVVGVVGETGTPPYEASDWYTTQKTNKSGHFRVAVPARMTGVKIGVNVMAGPLASTWHPNEWLEQYRKAPCAERLITVQVGTVQNNRYNLISGHSYAQGGCLQLLDNK